MREPAPWPIGESEMAARFRDFDWAGSALGPVATWPVELRVMVQAALELPQPASVCWGPDALLLYNDGYIEILGDKHPGALGRPLGEVWPELFEVVTDAVRDVMAGQPQSWRDVPFELAGRGEGLVTGWFTASWAPVRLSDGSVGGFQMVATESTLDHEARAQLRESEPRQAYLLALSDAIRPLQDPVAIQDAACALLGRHLGIDGAQYSEIDLDAGLIRNARDFFRADSGAHAGLPSHIGTYPLTVYPVHRAYWSENRCLAMDDVAADTSLSEGERVGLLTYSVAAALSAPLHKDGRLVAVMAAMHSAPRKWTASDVEMIQQTAERTWEAVERARSEVALREGEARLQLLLAELQHRVRNMLAVIRSVFSRTVSGAADLEDAADHFMGRLDSLARTQVTTTRNVEAGADLEDLIREELLSVGASDGPNVKIEGPDVRLSPKFAENIGLVLHELTVNAIKYGALKVSDAKLKISWDVDLDCRGVSQLRLTWTEQGVPAVPLSPTRYGFGSELILEAIPYRLGAETELEIRGGGIRCTISLPLA